MLIYFLHTETKTRKISKIVKERKSNKKIQQNVALEYIVREKYTQKGKMNNLWIRSQKKSSPLAPISMHF
jgi:hypothetical protein